MRLGWELNHKPCDPRRRKNDAPNQSATLPTKSTLAQLSLSYLALLVLYRPVALPGQKLVSRQCLDCLLMVHQPLHIRSNGNKLMKYEN